jgi:hypothetical protein
MLNTEAKVTESTLASISSYREAVDEFTRNATTLIENIPLFTRARDAYEQAIRASAEVRRVLDTGDDTLRMLMTEVEQAINIHVGRSSGDRRRSEGPKLEAIRADAS